METRTKKIKQTANEVELSSMEDKEEGLTL